MSELSFFKFQGSGNDFIFFDQRNSVEDFSPQIIQSLCDRRKGIGADGVIFLRLSQVCDYKMQIFNADGKEAKSCGNGLCCLYQFLQYIGVTKTSLQVELCQETVSLTSRGDRIAVQMNSPTFMQFNQSVCIQKRVYFAHIIHSGAPHAIVFVEDVKNFSVESVGRQLRYASIFQSEGININFVQVVHEKKVLARVYEKGVEAETLACGTGASAIAIAAHFIKKTAQKIDVVYPGGTLGISFATKKPSEVVELELLGSAAFVFKGVVEMHKWEKALC